MQPRRRESEPSPIGGSGKSGRRCGSPPSSAAGPRAASSLAEEPGHEWPSPSWTRAVSAKSRVHGAELLRKTHRTEPCGVTCLYEPAHRRARGDLEQPRPPPRRGNAGPRSSMSSAHSLVSREPARRISSCNSESQSSAALAATPCARPPQNSPQGKNGTRSPPQPFACCGLIQRCTHSDPRRKGAPRTTAAGSSSIPIYQRGDEEGPARHKTAWR